MTSTLSYFTTTNFITIPGETNSIFTRPGQTITIAIPTCSATIQPDSNGYVPPGSCNALWNYYPSFAAALLFTVLFGIVTATHIYQAFKYGKRWCWVIIVAGMWETTSFIFRTISTKHQQSSGILLIFQIFVLTAPLWINAFGYIVLGRLIHFFIPSHRLLGVPALAFATIFVALDMVTFIIQLVGGSMVSPTAPAEQQLKGTHIYMGGIGMQQTFIVIVTILAVKLHLKLLALDRIHHSLDKTKWKPLLFATYAVLGLITIRIIYRLIEFSSGPAETSGLANREAYFYILEAVPMLVALLAFNIVHPGAVLDGPRAEMPGLWSTLRGGDGWKRHPKVELRALK